MPASIERVSERFAELFAQAKQLPIIRGGRVSFYETVHWQAWATSAMHTMQLAFGSTSAHCQNFQASYQSKLQGAESSVHALIGIFMAAKMDWDAGFCIDLQRTVAGELFGDFVGLAKAALNEGQKDVAAVLACAALEDALKRFAVASELDVIDKNMQDIVNGIKSKGLLTGAQKSLLDTMPKIRDFAMHANWDKITPQDVGSVIGFVEQFLLQKFS